MSKSLNALGLICGIIGVLVLFKWGPPQPSFERGVGIGLESGTRLSSGKTVAQHNADISAAERRHRVMSRIGLGLVGLGFVFQLWGTMVYLSLLIFRELPRDFLDRRCCTVGCHRLSAFHFGSVTMKLPPTLLNTLQKSSPRAMWRNSSDTL
jgi:hypothetical protein